ncbi:MAG: cysteine desulfurase [Spirochaetota bacterium]|nr:cysteine desulfurase [Spirochaetota bacterium]
MSKNIYLDNNATTPIDPDVLNTMYPYLEQIFGNPNSSHNTGLETHVGLTRASDQLYASLNIPEQDTLVMTSSATESINTVHKSILFDFIKNKNSQNQIITSSVEHSAVRKSLAYLEKFGIEIISLPAINNSVSIESFQSKFQPEKTLLVSIGLANSETGILQPIKDIAKICHQNNILIHTDATQAIGKIPIDIYDLDVDYLSFSGHKFHAPKGIGGLYIKDSAPLIPLLHGGEQMGGFRSGTLNVAGIIAMGEALKIATKKLDLYSDSMLQLRSNLEDFLAQIPNCTIYGKDQDRIPNTTFFNIPQIDHDYLVWHLNNNNISVSTGSACTTKTIDLSLQTDSNRGVRVSTSKFTTLEEITILIDYISKLLN